MQRVAEDTVDVLQRVVDTLSTEIRDMGPPHVCERDERSHSVRSENALRNTAIEQPDWYAVLGLPPRFSPELAHVTSSDIKRARITRLREMKRGGEGDPALLNEAVEHLCESHSRERYDKYGHADLSEVRPGLFLGAESAARRPALLNTLGITHVLTASHSLEYLDEPLRVAGIKQITFDVEDEDDQDLRPFLGEGTGFIAVAISGGGKVLVHCYSGVSRSATFMAHYLMQSEGIDAATALSVICAARSKVDPKPGFRATLREYDHQ
jgi:hypothetical protein